MYKPMNSTVSLEAYYPGLEDLLPIAILCAISILSVVLWLLAVWGYVLRSRSRHVRESHSR